MTKAIYVENCNNIVGKLIALAPLQGKKPNNLKTINSASHCSSIRISDHLTLEHFCRPLQIIHGYSAATISSFSNEQKLQIQPVNLIKHPKCTALNQATEVKRLVNNFVIQKLTNISVIPVSEFQFQGPRLRSQISLKSFDK